MYFTSAIDNFWIIPSKSWSLPNGNTQGWAEANNVQCLQQDFQYYVIHDQFL